ncbi:hypothetical protein JTB14_020985 [Gonioctena quinquepunctata]|nr:hypothetical protein JTB14_020985 [Gonioctena quinquepunctata]
MRVGKKLTGSDNELHHVNASTLIKRKRTNIVKSKPPEKNILKKISSSSDNVKRPNATLKTNEEMKRITTKSPFRIRIKNVDSKLIPPTKITTPAPTTKFIKMKTKIFKLTTPRIKTKHPTHVINISNTAKTTPAKKKNPTVHKVVTKWADTADLGEIKQNWYEEGVPYPNPNPEISSSSPSFSLNDLSSISPLSYDAVETASNLNLMPEISSHSPSYSISDVPEILPDIPEVPDVSPKLPIHPML